MKINDSFSNNRRNNTKEDDLAAQIGIQEQSACTIFQIPRAMSIREYYTYSSRYQCLLAGSTPNIFIFFRAIFLRALA